MSEPADNHAEAEERPTTADASEEPAVIPAERLFGATREVWIDHNGVRYRLRVTRRGRLILTK